MDKIQIALIILFIYNILVICLLINQIYRIKYIPKKYSKNLTPLLQFNLINGSCLLGLIGLSLAVYKPYSGSLYNLYQLVWTEYMF